MPDANRRERRIVRLTTLPLALVGGLVGSVVVGMCLAVLATTAWDPSPAPAGWQVAVGFAITSALTAGALRGAFVPVEFPVSRLALHCALLGWLNTVLCLLASGGDSEAFAHSPGRWLLGAVIGGGVSGLFSGAPLGLLYAVVAMPAVHTALLYARAPTLDGEARVVRAVGVVAGVAGILAGGATSVLPVEALAVPGGALLVVGCAGLVAAVVAQVRLVRHARWVERVRCGAELGWAIVPLVRTHEDLPRAIGGSGAIGSLLVRLVDDERGGGYRRTTMHLPWAVTPGTARTHGGSAMSTD